MAVNTETDVDNVTKRQQLEEDGEVRERNTMGRLMHLEVFCVKEESNCGFENGHDSNHPE